MTLEVTPTELLFIVLLSALAALSITAAGTLASVSRDRYPPTWPLAAVFAIIAVLASARVLGAFGAFAVVPVARAVFLPMLLSTAPLLMAFGRGLLVRRTRWQARDGLHVVPAGGVFAVFVVMYGDQDGLGAAMRAWVGEGLGREIGVGDVVRATYWLFFLQWTVYGATTVRAQIRGRAVRKTFFSGMDQAADRRMRYVLLFVTVPWLSLVIQYVVSALGYPNALEPGASLFRIGCLGAFAIYAIRQTWIFELTEQERAHPEPVPRYQRSGLDAAAVERIGAKLETAMARDRLYRRSTLTLRELSDATGVSENHISETLNVFMGASFFDYVNGWRVRDAEQLLVTTDRTVLDILVDVGFNARSTFNAAFRKQTGMTPTAYRRAARKVSVSGAGVRSPG